MPASLLHQRCWSHPLYTTSFLRCITLRFTRRTNTTNIASAPLFTCPGPILPSAPVLVPVHLPATLRSPHVSPAYHRLKSHPGMHRRCKKMLCSASPLAERISLPPVYCMDQRFKCTFFFTSKMYNMHRGFSPSVRRCKCIFFTMLVHRRCKKGDASDTPAV